MSLVMPMVLGWALGLLSGFFLKVWMEQDEQEGDEDGD